MVLESILQFPFHILTSLLFCSKISLICRSLRVWRSKFQICKFVCSTKGFLHLFFVLVSIIFFGFEIIFGSEIGTKIHISYSDFYGKIFCFSLIEMFWAILNILQHFQQAKDFCRFSPGQGGVLPIWGHKTLNKSLPIWGSKTPFLLSSFSLIVSNPRESLGLAFFSKL